MAERDYSIDFIRLAAILAVVAIHTSTYFLDRTAVFSFNFYVLYGINQLFRFAVPLFFAISGYLLAMHYHKIANPLNFYKRRLSKILLPYICWTFIYFLIIFPNPLSPVFVSGFIHNLLTGDAAFQLYFIPAILILYLIFPILIYGKKLFLTRWFIFLLFLVEIFFMSFYYYQDKTPTIFPPLPVAFYNLLPFMIGIYAAVNIKDLRKFISNKLFVFIISSILFWAILIFESLYMFKTTGRDMFLRNQWRISVTIYGLFAGTIMYYFYSSKWNKVISYLAKYSFGVFFVHVAILHNLLVFMYSYKLYDLGSFVLALVLTTAGSFLFSIILSKIKFINLLLGLKS